MQSPTHARTTFIVRWLDWRQRTYATTSIESRDLTAAIKSAARTLAAGKEPNGDAHGFHVHAMTPMERQHAIVDLDKLLLGS